MIVPIAPKGRKQQKAKTLPAKKAAAPELRATHDRMATHDMIRERAFHIYEVRGRAPGHDVQDWLRAEHQVLAR